MFSKTDEFRLRSLEIRSDDDGNAVVTDNNGGIVASFHGLTGCYGEDVFFDAFIDGVVAISPEISIWNESRASYVVCGGRKYLEYERRYADEPPASALPKP
jgi:hypothetical protein